MTTLLKGNIVIVLSCLISDSPQLHPNMVVRPPGTGSTDQQLTVSFFPAVARPRVAEEEPLALRRQDRDFETKIETSRGQSGITLAGQQRPPTPVSPSHCIT